MYVELLAPAWLLPIRVQKQKRNENCQLEKEDWFLIGIFQDVWEVSRGHGVRGTEENCLQFGTGQIHHSVHGIGNIQRFVEYIYITKV